MGVCVCLICKDVKLRFWLFTSYAGGRGIQSGTTSNEATWLYGIQSLISSAYLQLEFSGIARGQAQNPKRRTWYICTVVTIWTSFWFFEQFISYVFTWSPTTSSPTYWLGNPRRRLRRWHYRWFIYFLILILFDVDSEYEDHSGELPLFVGCIVD